MYKRVVLSNLLGAICISSLAILLGACTSDEEVKTAKKKKKTAVAQNIPRNQVPMKPGKLSESQIQYLKLDTPSSLGVPNAHWYLVANTESTQCSKSSKCRQSGQCSQISLKRSIAQAPVEVTCVALDRQLCLQSTNCQQKGQCTPKFGSCQVESNLDCFQSQRCRSYGLCNVDQGTCVAKSDKDCEQSLACQDFKACTFKAGLCVNQEDASQKCNYGCVSTQEGCFCHPDPPVIKLRKNVEPACLTQCRKLGKCGLKDQGCAPRNSKDCEFSESCKTHGYCSYKDGTCGLSDVGCATSLMCSLIGRCNLVNGLCAATSEDDCKSSRACAEKESCHFKPIQQSSTVGKETKTQEEEILLNPIQAGECVLPKRQQDCSDLCVRLGQCEAIDGVCLAVSNVRCRASQVCKKYGHCSPRGGKCIAVSQRDCKRGLNCKQFGYCTPSKGQCIKR